MSIPFEIEVLDVSPHLSVLRVRGRLDSHTAATLIDHCDRVRHAGKNLVINLSSVSFIASSGIGALLVLAEDFGHIGRKIRLAEVAPSVAAVIRLLNLEQFLNMDETEHTSVEALKAA